jgi:hypothetical protein
MFGIEVYAFLAALTVQILIVSVMYPTWFIRFVRARNTRLLFVVFVLFRAAPLHGIYRPHRHRHRHAGLRIPGTLRLRDALWQKQESVCDARGSATHARSGSQDQRLHVHRDRCVRLSQPHPWTGGSGAMGTVRAEYFFHRLHADSFRGRARETAPTRRRARLMSRLATALAAPRFGVWPMDGMKKSC